MSLPHRAPVEMTVRVHPSTRENQDSISILSRMMLLAGTAVLISITVSIGHGMSGFGYLSIGMGAAILLATATIPNHKSDWFPAALWACWAVSMPLGLLLLLSVGPASLAPAILVLMTCVTEWRRLNGAIVAMVGAVTVLPVAVAAMVLLI